MPHHVRVHVFLDAGLFAEFAADWRMPDGSIGQPGLWPGNSQSFGFYQRQ